MKFLLSALLLLLFTASNSLADGLPIKDGHWEGKVTVLKLTPEQANYLTGDSNDGQLTLTAEQREVLAKESGRPLADMPEKVSVFSVEIATGMCGCDAANYALHTAPDEVEVAHRFLMSEEEAQNPDE